MNNRKHQFVSVFWNQFSSNENKGEKRSKLKCWIFSFLPWCHIWHNSFSCKDQEIEWGKVCHNKMLYVYSCAASPLSLSPCFLDRAKKYQVKQASPIRTSGTTTEATPTALFISMAVAPTIACTGNRNVHESYFIMSIMLSVTTKQTLLT